MPDSERLAAAYAELYLRFVRAMDRRMTDKGASLARTRLLRFLQRKGPSRASDIADLFSHSPRSVTEAVDALERDGLVQRQPDPSDRRAKLITITPKGEEAVIKTEPLRRRMVEQTFGALTEEERKWLEQILLRLSATLEPKNCEPKG